MLKLKYVSAQGPLLCFRAGGRSFFPGGRTTFMVEGWRTSFT